MCIRSTIYVWLRSLSSRMTHGNSVISCRDSSVSSSSSRHVQPAAALNPSKTMSDPPVDVALMRLFCLRGLTDGIPHPPTPFIRRRRSECLGHQPTPLKLEWQPRAEPVLVGMEAAAKCQRGRAPAGRISCLILCCLVWRFYFSSTILIR